MTAAIEIINVTYRYPKGGFVFSCPRLEFPAGEITLITGHNGSGKTTLSKLMCGILRPKEGELRIFGEPANDWPLGKIGSRIGYLFQDPSRQLFAATVWEELLFVDSILGRDQEAASRKAKRLLERFGLAPLAERSVYRLSRGEKQRLALCTILMGEAEYFILDEPTSGLDRGSRAKLCELMDDLVAMGKGLAVITHDKELIERYGMRNVRLEEGRVIA
jgi:energy-coupling factor transport system ATP-binding protein